MGEELRENQDEVEDDDAADCSDAGAVAWAAAWGCDVGLAALSSGVDPVSAWRRDRNFWISGSMVLLLEGASWGVCAESAGAGVFGGDGVAQSQPMIDNVCRVSRRDFREYERQDVGSVGMAVAE